MRVNSLQPKSMLMNSFSSLTNYLLNSTFTQSYLKEKHGVFTNFGTFPFYERTLIGKSF